MTAAVNVGVSGEAAFLFPRAEETPSPHYDHALGGMELFGRFVFLEEEGFSGARGEDLERSLELALHPLREVEARSLRAVLEELGEGGA